MLDRPFAHIFFSPDAGGAGGSGSSNNQGDPAQKTGDQSGDGTGDSNATTPSFEDFLKAQPDPIKKAYEAHSANLRNALQSERDSRKDLEKQIKGLAAKAEKGSDLETELSKISTQLAESDRRAVFFEQAHEAGVSNLRLAFIAAVQDDLFDRNGNPDLTALKQRYPELFGARPAPGKRVPAGSGNGSSGQIDTARSMNDFIRRSAGR